MAQLRPIRSARISVRVTDGQKLSLQTLARALNRQGLQVTESQLVEFLISTAHHYYDNPAVIAPALTAWRSRQEV